jgi:hypothetical protein
LRLARHDTALRKASPLGKAPPDTASTSLLVSLPSRHPRRGSLLSLCRVEGEEFHAQLKFLDAGFSYKICAGVFGGWRAKVFAPRPCPTVSFVGIAQARSKSAESASKQIKEQTNTLRLFDLTSCDARDVICDCVLINSEPGHDDAVRDRALTQATIGALWLRLSELYHQNKALGVLVHAAAAALVICLVSALIPRTIAS